MSSLMFPLSKLYLISGFLFFQSCPVTPVTSHDSRHEEKAKKWLLFVLKLGSGFKTLPGQKKPVTSLSLLRCLCIFQCMKSNVNEQVWLKYFDKILVALQCKKFWSLYSNPCTLPTAEMNWADFMGMEKQLFILKRNISKIVPIYVRHYIDIDVLRVSLGRWGLTHSQFFCIKGLS